MRDAGLDPGAIERREIGSDEEAVAEGFVGSPTIRVEGEDVEAPGPGEPPGLACRVYRRADGRVSPLPDADRVRAALRRAVEPN
jgi:hypothetical protein